MSDTEDPAVTLEAKLHHFVEGLTPDEVKVFNDLLLAWSEAASAEVEGFGTGEPDVRPLLDLISTVVRDLHTKAQEPLENLQG